MNLDKPKIKVPYQSVDVVIELASIVVLLLMWFYVIMEFTNLPDSIPSHFNSKGQPDNYSNKGIIWFLPVLATLIYSGLFTLNRFPHLHNYTVNINKENAPKQYRFSTRVLRVVNFLCVLMFAYISYQLIIGAKNQQSDLGLGFVITVVGISVLLPVFIFVYQRKL
ncbi:MAG: DUF1648 domain-containing protein [Winogradskyella sp.]|nr:DUF1648 domain-containing protein [Winogradskyella sp.]